MPIDFSIFRSFQQTAEGGIEMFFPEHFATRSVRKTCPLRYMTQGNSIGDGLMHGYRANAFLIGTRSQY
jgi:hypothetical protein